MSENLIKLKEELNRISENNKLCIALSDGVDSTVLLKVAIDTGLDVLPVNINTNFYNEDILNYVNDTAKTFDLALNIIDVNMFENKNIINNRENRCYHCKRKMFEEIKKFANNKNYNVICDGTNCDDIKSYRPGLKAKEELDIKSPYVSCDINKQEVRELAKELNLKVAIKPSNSCILTRFPYNTVISDDMIKKAYEGEDILHKLGFKDCRLKIEEDEAKIKIKSFDYDKFLDNKEEIKDNLISIGYKKIILEKI